MGQMRVHRTGPWVKISCPFSWVQFIPRVGQRVSLEGTSKIKHLKIADYERKSPESGDSGDFWWRLLDSNQWPHACEDSIGMSSAGFRENKATLSRDFLTRRYAFLHCFRPGVSVRGSRRGSKRKPRFQFASDKALSYNKAGFLTEYAELGKMRSGAARTAGGYGYTPAKGVLLMRITLHIGRFTVTIIVKSRNRHSGK